MVNILKRMRKLDERLLRIRTGPGAATIPPPSKQIPYITRIHLTHPYGPGTFTPAYHGSRIFWRTHLPRLKYYNPALPISVTHEKAAGNVVTGHIEGEKNTGDTKLQQSLPDEREDSKGARKALESDAEANLTVWFDDTITSFTPTQPNYEDYQPSTSTSPANPTNTSTTPSSSSSSTPHSPTSFPAGKTATSTRAATLSTRGLSASKIYAWLQSTCGLTPVQHEIDAETGQPWETTRREELNAFKRKAAEDRQMVKKGMDAKRAHDAMLRRARGDAERLRGES